MHYRNRTQNHLFVIMALSFLALFAFAAWAPNVDARSSYLSAFTTRYPATAGTQLDSCGVCHGSSTSTWNSYGQAIRSQGSGVAIDTRLANVEQADSDGDGFSNIVEINAGTFPGNASSTPAPAAGALSVSSGSLSSTGTAGGPFSPSSQSFTLSNTGGQSINWTASKTQSWVTLSSSGGSLAAGANATVTVSINSGANSLAASSSAYTDTVTFTNTTNGTGNATRSVSLMVSAASPENTSPTANAGPDQTVTAGSGGTASVTLNGSGSSDPDPGDSISSYSWSWPPSGTATGASPAVTLDVGTHTITLTVQDTNGGSDTDTVVVTVNAETQPPATGDLSVTPEDGAVDVPITTAVIVSADVAGVLDGVTVTLTESTPSFTSAEVPGEAQCVSNGVVNGSFASDGPNTVTFTPDCPLANGMTYTVTITPKGATEPMTSTFTTIVQTADTDQDGVEDSEDEHPDDDTEATPPKSKGEGKFRVSVGKDEHGYLRNVRGISDTHFSINQEEKPLGYEFRDGLVDYEVHGISPGDSVEVDIAVPEEIPSGSKVYMADWNGFHEIPAVISGNRFTITVTDGGVGDSDGQANGVIVDPVGVAVPTAIGDGSAGASPDAAGGGCSVVGSGGGWKEAAGSYGLLILVLLGLALRRRKPETGR